MIVKDNLINDFLLTSVLEKTNSRMTSSSRTLVSIKKESVPPSKS